MPHLSDIIFAVAGKNMSGVAVAQITKSTSSGGVFVLSNNPRTACSPRSELPRPSPLRILLSFIPTRCIIHSSEVSTIFCLLYTSDAADEEDSVDLGGRRI